METDIKMFLYRVVYILLFINFIRIMLLIGANHIACARTMVSAD